MCKRRARRLRLGKRKSINNVCNLKIEIYPVNLITYSCGVKYLKELNVVVSEEWEIRSEEG